MLQYSKSCCSVEVPTLFFSTSFFVMPNIQLTTDFRYVYIIVKSLIISLPGQIPQSRSVLRKTQYVVRIALGHFNDEMEKSHSRLVSSGVKQFW